MASRARSCLPRFEIKGTPVSNTCWIGARIPMTKVKRTAPSSDMRQLG